MDGLCCEDNGGAPQGPGSVCGGWEACCDPATGACYMADRTCCLSYGDDPQGPGNECAAPEACCFDDGACQDLDPRCCVAQGGEPKGPESACQGDGNDDGIDDACEEVVIVPTVSQWGLTLMALLGVTAGAILFRRRPASDSAV